MSVLQNFFAVTRRELNNMVTWRDDAPVAEFWEMFDRAEQEAAQHGVQPTADLVKFGIPSQAEPESKISGG